MTLTEQHNQFVFYSEKLQFKAVATTKGKDYFITGYISTGDVDLVNDIVTKGCMDSMLTQFDDKTIKLDFEHEAFRGSSPLEVEANKSKIVLGKAIGKERDSKGVKVTWKMNPTWKKFDEKGNVTMDFKDLWSNVEDGFYDAFSIAYVPTRTSRVERAGKSIRLLDNVNLLNVALTGNPVNPAASMTAVMAKSLAFMNELEGDVDLDNVEIKDFDILDQFVNEFKAKYRKRTGSPGHYKYEYAEGQGPNKGPKKTPESLKEKHKEKIQRMQDKLKKNTPSINYQAGKIQTYDDGLVTVTFTSKDGQHSSTEQLEKPKNKKTPEKNDNSGPDFSSYGERELISYISDNSNKGIGELSSYGERELVSEAQKIHDSKKPKTSNPSDKKPSRDSPGREKLRKQNQAAHQALGMAESSDFSHYDLADKFYTSQLEAAKEHVEHPDVAKKIDRAIKISKKKPQKKSSSSKDDNMEIKNMETKDENLEAEVKDVTPEVTPEAKAEDEKEDEDSEDEKKKKTEDEPEKKDVDLTEIKSRIDKLEKENAELKAIVEKPQMKSIGTENKTEAKSAESEKKSFNGPMDLIA